MPAPPDRAALLTPDAPAEVVELLRRLDVLAERARREREGLEAFESALAGADASPMLAGHATPEATRRLAARLGRDASGFYRPAQGLLVSSLGVGTNRGAADDETDAGYARTVHAACRGGINLVDTALNYRRQRSERAVGAGLRVFIRDGGARDEVVLCTKGGYLVPGAFSERTLSDRALDELHCMAPAFLEDQIARSRRNLGVETIDVYYLHNPETELRSLAAPLFMRRIRAAFAALERTVADGLVRFYGAATWDGLRTGALSLRDLADAAREVAGERHHFRFVQLPFNLGMQEALRRRPGGEGSLVDVAAELGITVVTSASLAHARLLDEQSAELRDRLLALPTDAVRAIQFARSAPGIASALVGMRQAAHVAENLAVARVPPLTSDDYAWAS